MTVSWCMSWTWAIWSLLTLSPVLGVYGLPPVRAILRMQPYREYCVVETIWTVYADLCITFKILACSCRDLLILWPPKTSIKYKFSCLLNLPPINLGWSASLVSSSHLCSGVNFQTNIQDPASKCHVSILTFKVLHRFSFCSNNIDIVKNTFYFGSV